MGLFLCCLFMFFYFQGSSNFPGQYIESQGVSRPSKATGVCVGLCCYLTKVELYIEKHLVYSLRWESLYCSRHIGPLERDLNRIKSQIDTTTSLGFPPLAWRLCFLSLGRVVQHPPHRVLLGIISGRSSWYIHHPRLLFVDYKRRVFLLLLLLLDDDDDCGEKIIRSLPGYIFNVFRLSCYIYTYVYYGAQHSLALCSL